MPKTTKVQLKELHRKVAELAVELNAQIDVLKSVVSLMNAVCGELIKMGEDEDDIPF